MPWQAWIHFTSRRFSMSHPINEPRESNDYEEPGEDNFTDELHRRSPVNFAHVHLPSSPPEIIMSAMWMASEGMVGLPRKPNFCSISDQVPGPSAFEGPRLN